MNKTHIVVTDFVESDLSWEVEQFARMGAQLFVFQLPDGSAEQILAAAGDADIMIVNVAKITAQVIAGLSRCRLILRCGPGNGNIDLEAAARCGITVGDMPDYCTTEVAEHTVMLMLACLRQLDDQRWMFNRALLSGKWAYDQVAPVFQLKGKTVGIIGFGRVGSRVYRMLKGFEVNFIVYDPYISEERCREYGVRRAPLEALLQEADLVSVHVPLNRETFHLIDAPQLEQMKPTAVLINTAHGSVVNVAALRRALDQGRIGAAGIDVYAPEEPPKSSLALLGGERVICTPHAAWMSREAAWRIRAGVVENVRQFLAGQGVKHRLTAAAQPVNL